MLQQTEYKLGLTATRRTRHDARERGAELGETLAHLCLHHLYEATPRRDRALVQNEQQQRSLSLSMLFLFIYFSHNMHRNKWHSKFTVYPLCFCFFFSISLYFSATCIKTMSFHRPYPYNF